jgi:hypothetical protein
MLASLVPENLSLILNRLQTGDLLSLRATSKAFLSVITPRVFSDFQLDLCADDPSRQLQSLRSLSNPSCTIAPYIISLHIESLHTAGDYKLPRAVLSKYLAPAISKLRNLETAR